MAADSSIWSASQGSEIRLPGGDAELGVEQQPQQQHLKGGGGAEIHGSSSSFEEWYDASLIDEMKELSSYQRHHHHQNPASHHHQIRNSASSPAAFAAAADRRSFSSTFLDVDESGFLGDFAAAATATGGGLLPPPPPPLLPPPPPPRHRFGGGDIGLLDFGGGGGGAAGGAAAWAGPNFGLSIGTMSGAGFSSKPSQVQQQHTGSGHSSPSTIIKSPTSAFASADSSLEIGGGGDVEVGAVAPATGRRRRKGGGGGGGGGSSSSPPAVGEEAGLDGREDEDMDDASGLLCETDDMGGQPAPATGQQGGPGGGKGNRKGLPAKNLMAERRRRKKLNDRLYMLRSVVPRITKMDRASILGDAIEYLKELLQRINELHNELESPGDGPLGPSDQHMPPLAGMLPAPPPLLMPPTCVKEECGGGAGGAAPPPPPSASEPPKVEVRTRDGKTINIHMFCARRPGLLLSTMRALDGLGLDVQQAVISCFNGFVLDVFRAEQCREGEIAPEDIKSALLHTAGCNNEAMSS